jgi:predicted Rossmann fold flavoprotein
MSPDLIVVGAGAAGLMAAIQAGRRRPEGRIVLLDSARKPGAKILVSGGGRCNVTHRVVESADYAGSTPHAIRKVLARFDVPATVAFFRELGVALKEEATGKLFPVSDSARSVLDALLAEVRRVGVQVHHPARVEQVEKSADQFTVSGPWGSLSAPRLILATGGCSLPKSGSDGHGLALARSLGHTVTPLFPALVPLLLPDGHPLRALSGLAAPALLELWQGNGKRLAKAEGAVLCTHFGLSGPAILDISRHFLTHSAGDPATTLTLNWLPDHTPERLEQALLTDSQAAWRMVRDRLPERLSRSLREQAGWHSSDLTRAQRRELVALVTRRQLPVTGSRGYTHAEVTAGGVPLAELNLRTLESRLCPGLHLCGEICDVDGRIGGFNFQWAWASGFVAGQAAI